MDFHISISSSATVSRSDWNKKGTALRFDIPDGTTNSPNQTSKSNAVKNGEQVRILQLKRTSTGATYAEVQSGARSAGPTSKRGWIKFKHLKLNVTKLHQVASNPPKKIASSENCPFSPNSDDMSTTFSGIDLNVPPFSPSSELEQPSAAKSQVPVPIPLNTSAPEIDWQPDASDLLVSAENTIVSAGSWPSDLGTAKSTASFQSVKSIGSSSDWLQSSCLSLLEHLENDFSPSSTNSMFERSMSGVDVTVPQMTNEKRNLTPSPSASSLSDGMPERRRMRKGSSLGDWTTQTLMTSSTSKREMDTMSEMLKHKHSFLSLFTRGADLARLAVNAEKDAYKFYTECTKFLSAALQKRGNTPDAAHLTERIRLYKARARGLHALQFGSNVSHVQPIVQPAAMVRNNRMSKEQLWHYRQQVWNARKLKYLTCQLHLLRVLCKDGSQQPLGDQQQRGMLEFRREQLSSDALNQRRSRQIMSNQAMFIFDDEKLQLLYLTASADKLPVILMSSNIPEIGNVPRDDSKEIGARIRMDWTLSQNMALAQAVTIYGKANWARVSTAVPGRSPDQCRQHWTKTLEPQKNGRNTGRWNPTEKTSLKSIVDGYLSMGIDKDQLDWHEISITLGTRDQKQCKEQYTKNLDPNLKVGDWSKEEDIQIWDLKAKGMGWEAIARQISLPNAVRTGDRVKKRHQALARRKQRMKNLE